jgi:hypothetical protein
VIDMSPTPEPAFLRKTRARIRGFYTGLPAGVQAGGTGIGLSVVLSS